MSQPSQEELIKFGSILIQSQLAKEKQSNSLCFRFKNHDNKTIMKIRNLEELSTALQELSYEEIIRHMPLNFQDQDEHHSLYLWLGYILGDFNLAAKIFRIRSNTNLSEKKMLSQIVTTVWNRLMNYFEIDVYFQQKQKEKK